MTPLNELLQRVNQGDSLAVNELVGRYSVLIEQECRKFGILQHPELSHSDLYQEVMLRAWTHIDQFRGGDDSAVEALFESWLRVTARSVLNNIGRRQTAQKRRPNQPIARLEAATEAYVKNSFKAKTASSIFSLKEESDRLIELIQTILDEESKQVLMLKIVEGLSLKQISEQTELTYDQVRYRYDNAIKALESRM